ncbi:MAG: hypothetical protein HC915_12790 [Anaerolineae bacterium]|nr:hypothetical protein [Anaerolineae bacterium]
MIFNDFWDIVLNPVFLVTFGLVMAAFVPLGLSVLVTWQENAEHTEAE